MVFRRPAGTNMIKCISYWSIAKGSSGQDRPIDEAMDEAKQARFDGIELAVGLEGPFSISTDEASCAKYRNLAEKRGLAIETVATGFAWTISPTSLDPATRQRSIEAHSAAVERAAWLGAKAMLMVPGAVKIPWDDAYKPVPYEAAVRRARDAVSAVAKVAEKHRVDLCVENVWNGLFYSPLEFAGFIDSIGSSRVGAYFDVGNVLGYHQHPPDWIKILGERIRRVHIKDFKTSIGGLNGFCDLLQGDVPWAQTMQALREIGYTRTIVAEMMPPAPGRLERTSSAMDRIFEM
jgi:hexulose-6-phosphate isomerase